MGFEFKIAGAEPSRRPEPALIALWNSKRQAFGLPLLDKRGLFDPMGFAHTAEKIDRRTFGASALKGTALAFKVFGLVTGNPILKGIGMALGKGGDRVAKEAADLVSTLPGEGIGLSVALEFVHAVKVLLDLRSQGRGSYLLPFAPYNITNSQGITLDVAALPGYVVDSALYNAMGRNILIHHLETRGLVDLSQSDTLEFFGKMQWLLTGYHFSGTDQDRNVIVHPKAIFSSGVADPRVRWTTVTRPPLSDEDKAQLAGQERKFVARAALRAPAIAAARSLHPEFDDLVELQHGRAAAAKQSNITAGAAQEFDQQRAEAIVRDRIAFDAMLAARPVPTAAELRATIGNPAEAFQAPAGAFVNQMPEPFAPPVSPPASATPFDPPVIGAADNLLPPAPPVGPVPIAIDIPNLAGTELSQPGA